MEHRDRDRDTPRLVKSRVVLAILGGVLALGVGGVAGSQLVVSLKQWLHRQKQYETTFSAIALDPPPPGWYRGGAALFLERVRESAQRPGVPFSALDVDLAEVAREFRLYCWVRRVQRVERKWPNHIVVRLDYRQPVARARLPGNAGLVLVDSDGVILPLEDIDLEAVGGTILIAGDPPFDPPFEPRPGRVWMSSEGKSDERLFAALKLASFLESALARVPRPIPPALRPKAIHSMPGDGLFIENAEVSLIYWGEAPGAERPGNLSAQDKWERLQRWLPNRPPTPVHRPFYLAFTREGIVIKESRAQK